MFTRNPGPCVIDPPGGNPPAVWRQISGIAGLEQSRVVVMVVVALTQMC